MCQFTVIMIYILTNSYSNLSRYIYNYAHLIQLYNSHWQTVQSWKGAHIAMPRYINSFKFDPWKLTYINIQESLEMHI